MLHVYGGRWLSVMLACLLALSLLAACTIEESSPTPTPEKIPPPVAPIPVEEISLEEAEEIVGVHLVPKYLPPGFEFRRGFLIGDSAPPHADLIFYFSDKEVEGEVKTARDFESLTHTKIILNVDQVVEMPSPDIYEGMAKQHGGKVVDINETKGWLAGGPGGCQLIWFQQGLILHLYTVNKIPEEELVKIAESIG